MRRFHCHSCNRHIHEQHTVMSHAGKAGLCTAGLAAGAATKNPWAAIGGALLGVVVGAIIDDTIGRTCPTCGTVLKLIVSNSLA